jgi:hypothetical protein
MVYRWIRKGGIPRLSAPWGEGGTRLKRGSVNVGLRRDFHGLMMCVSHIRGTEMTKLSPIQSKIVVLLRLWPAITHEQMHVLLGRFPSLNRVASNMYALTRKGIATVIRDGTEIEGPTKKYVL